MQVRVRVRVMVRMGCGHDGLGRGGWRGVSGGGGVGGGRVPVMTEASLTEPNDRKRLFVCFVARLCVCVFLLLIGGSRCASLPSAAPSASAPPRRPHPCPPQPSLPAQKRNPSWSTSGATTGGRLPTYPLHGGLRSDREAPSGRFTPSSGGRLRASPGPARLAAAAAAR